VGGAVDDRSGGIFGLRRLLREHGEAVEYDLIERGLRLWQLGTAELSWRDLWVLVRNVPQSSALGKARDPEGWMWDLPAFLMAGQFDALQGANWQRAGDPKAKRPDPLPRPGVVPAEVRKPSTPTTIEKLRKRLGMDRPRH
jgi:hypothetical protein